jgi:hypothetical protein
MKRFGSYPRFGLVWLELKSFTAETALERDYFMTGMCAVSVEIQ